MSSSSGEHRVIPSLYSPPLSPATNKGLTRPGIGYAVAEASLASSARVTISSSSHTKVANSLKALQVAFPSLAPGTVRGHVCNLAKATCENDITILFQVCGHVDHIVFTAGDPLATVPIADATWEKIVQAGQVRFIAPLLVAKIGSKYMTSSPESSIVLTTGSVSERPIKDWSIVAGYAAGLHGMTRNLALDLKPIRVNLVSPGAVDTELWGGMKSEDKEKMFTNIAGKVPTGKVGRREFFFPHEGGGITDLSSGGCCGGVFVVDEG